MKKGQTSLLIIIGVVLLVLFLSVMFLSMGENKRQAEDRLKETQQVSSDIEPIFNYAHNCFESAATEGLFLLGRQAGFIYRSQGGKSIDYTPDMMGGFYLKYEGVGIPYRITLPVRGMWCSSVIPDYPSDQNGPYATYPYRVLGNPADADYIMFRQQDCFGKKIRFDLDQVLEELRYYIENKIQECDFSAFKGYEFEFGAPKVVMGSGPTTTYADIDYPITITNVNTGMRSELSEFKVILKISLKDLFTFTNEIMEEDVSDPYFDISVVANPDYRVFVNNNVYNKDDLVSVRAYTVNLNGKPFEMRFARMNRPPALIYVRDNSYANPDIKAGIDSTATAFVTSSDIVRTEIKAVDPDEDTVTINIFAAEGTPRKTNVNSVPYGITAGDVSNGYLNLRFEATDGQYTDYQTGISIGVTS